jgi:hypothetical protein
MFIELNEEQVRFAFDKNLRIHTVERSIMLDGRFAYYGAWVNTHLTNIDIEKSITRLSTFYMHKKEYDQLPAEIRALSSPEPKSQPVINTTEHLVPFDEHDQAHHFGNEKDDVVLILPHIVTDGKGNKISSGVEIQKCAFKESRKLGWNILIEKEMKTSEDRFKESWGDKLYDKLLKDIIPEGMGNEEFNILREWVVSEIKKDILEENYDIHLISEIENNEIFRRSIDGVYWGWDKEIKPTAKDLVPLIIACKIKPVSLRGYVSTGLYKESHTMATSMINPEDKDLVKKYKFYAENRFISIINRLALSISSESLGLDLYKKFLFINS